MTAPTSFPGEKPEAASQQPSTVCRGEVCEAKAITALESLVSLALIMLIVWLWLGINDEGDEP